MLTIRPAAPADVEEVHALLRETWRATYDPIIGPEKVREITARWHAPDALARSIADERGVFLVAERDGALAAMSFASPDGEGAVCLRQLYVRPGAQGGGIGRRLLEATLAPFGDAETWLEVEARNERAIAFYARCGFGQAAPRASCGDRTDLASLRMFRRPRPDLTLRPVRDDDAQDLFGLLTLCFAEYPGCFTDPHGDLPDLRAPASHVAGKPGAAFWAVEDGRGRVGACVMADFPETGTAELHRLYVRPDLRRRGLGERLVRIVEEHARAGAARRIVFWSDTRFTGAHRLYERLGYRRSPLTRDLGDISNSVEFHFAKEL